MTYVHYHIYYSKLNSYVTTIFYIYFIKFKLLCVTILSVTTFLVLTLMFNLAPYPHSYADCQAYVKPYFCNSIM